jgi:uncharacterized protein (TIGR02996 family)
MSQPELPLLLAQERAFLQSIQESPDDDSIRLILADWLEDNGQPERAEFIRVQVRVEQLPVGSPARLELQARERRLQQHEREWLGPLAELLLGWSWRRGLLWVRIHASSLVAEGLGAIGWVESLEVTGLRGGIGLVLACPHLPHLTRLGLGWNDIGEAGAQALAASPLVSRFSALDLDGNKIGDSGVIALASSPFLARLTTLDLGRNNIGEKGVLALASSTHLEQLAWLRLRCEKAPEHAIEALLRRFGDRVHITPVGY